MVLRLPICSGPFQRIEPTAINGRAIEGQVVPLLAGGERIGEATIRGIETRGGRTELRIAVPDDFASLLGYDAGLDSVGVISVSPPVCWGCDRPIWRSGAHHTVHLSGGTVLHTHFGDCEDLIESFLKTERMCAECGVTLPSDHRDWCSCSEIERPS